MIYHLTMYHYIQLLLVTLSYNYQYENNYFHNYQHTIFEMGRNFWFSNFSECHSGSITASFIGDFHYGTVVPIKGKTLFNGNPIECLTRICTNLYWIFCTYQIGFVGHSYTRFFGHFYIDIYRL